METHRAPNIFQPVQNVEDEFQFEGPGSNIYQLRQKTEAYLARQLSQRLHGASLLLLTSHFLCLLCPCQKSFETICFCQSLGDGDCCCGFSWNTLHHSPQELDCL